MSHSPDAGAQAVLAHALRRPATLGRGRLVCVDGPAGSGKTTLAAAVARRRPDAAVVHMDDLYLGWDGLVTSAATLYRLLAPLAENRPGHYRRFDWVADRPAEVVTVPPRPLVVVEGVGAAVRRIAPWITTLAWVEAPSTLRRSRGLDRDGVAYAEHWRRFAAQEDRHFMLDGTRARADIRLRAG